MSTTISLKRNLYKAIFERNHHKKNDKSTKKYLMRHLYQKTVEGKIMSTSTQIYLKKSSPPNYLRRKLSTKQTLHKSLFQTNSKRNLYQRILEETCLPNIVRRQLSMKNKMKKYIPINLFKQFLYQNFSKKTRKL